ncbi:MAG: RNA methyltransferase [Syntrophaceae bacterium]|nr:RNA methyltransferase [Syntrophaceae bacterium]
MLKPSKGQLKFWAGLDLGKNRHREGRFLAEGVKVVREALRSSWNIDHFLVRGDKAELWQSLLPAMSGKAIYELSESEWKKISQDKESEGVAAVIAKPLMLPVRDVIPGNHKHILLLYQISNPLNLGAILRSTHWFGVKTVLLSEGSVDFTHPKVVRSSMGSLFHLQLYDDVDFRELLPHLKKDRFVISTSVLGGIPPHFVDKPSVVLLGSESHGLPEELQALTDECWCIPRIGDAESLSLPQAAAIIVYEWTKE